MATGGFKAGAGRPPGARNKSTIMRENVQREVARRLSNQTPSMTVLDIVQTIAREAFSAGNFDTALAAARECLPYLHPRLAPIAPADPNAASIAEILNDDEPEIMRP